MTHATAPALALIAALLAAPALAQTSGTPMPGMPGAMPGRMPGGGMPDMTREQAEAMAGQMMQQLGGRMGLDPEALRNATPEQRREMLRGGAAAISGEVQQQMEQSFGMPLDQLKGLSEDELRARMTARLRPPMPAADAFPLHYAPPGGFPDGATALPVAADYSADLAFDAPAREVLLVVADTGRRRILWRETRTAPFEQHLDLAAMAPDPSAVVVEVIDPDSHRVIRRYRPVAAE